MRLDESSKRGKPEKTTFMKISIFRILFFLFLFHDLSAQDSTRTGLIYGHDHSYYLTAPIGWVIDNQNGKELGMNAVFYPIGSSWADAETVIYTTYIGFDTTKNETVNDVVKADSIQYKNTSPEIRISKQSPILIGKNKKAIVYSFSIEGNYETAAYVAEKKGVIVIVLSSKNKNGGINNYRSFEALVRSYRFLTDKVNIN
jgi:hypothetical protein